MVILIVTLVVLVLLVSGGMWVAGQYNGLIRLRNLVQGAWRQIDDELRRRHDLVPNVIEMVKAHAPQEPAVPEEVARARAAAINANGAVLQRGRAEGALSAALERLFVLAAADPRLIADQNFAALQTELSEIGDRVAAGQRFYNANVRELNARVDSLPSSLFAQLVKVGPAEYFDLTPTLHS